MLRQSSTTQQADGAAGARTADKVAVDRERQVAMLDQQIQTIKGELSCLKSDETSQDVQLRYKDTISRGRRGF